MKWWNKETRNEEGKFYGVRFIERSEDWSNPKGNFVKDTESSPSDDSVRGLVECDFDNGDFIDDPLSFQSNENKKTAIQAFRSSKFNNTTIEAARKHIDDDNWTSLAKSKETFFKLIEFNIGLREILRELINNYK